MVLALLVERPGGAIVEDVLGLDPDGGLKLCDGHGWGPPCLTFSVDDAPEDRVAAMDRAVQFHLERQYCRGMG
jgi:hypothetical protein